MIEKVYKYSTDDNKIVEKIILDDNLNYIHMVFNKDEGMPEHNSNSNVYITVLRGKLSLRLNDESINYYEKSNVVKIPKGIKMNIKNLDNEVLELIIVKAPAPTFN